jgi:hypothetical protein
MKNFPNLKHFCSKGGKIILAVYPNGVGVSKDGMPIAKFTLSVSLFNDSTETINGINGKNLISELLHFAKSNLSGNIKLFVENNEGISVSPFDDYDPSEKLAFWSGLGNLSETYIFPKSHIDNDSYSNNPFFELEDKTLEKLLSIPYDPIGHIAGFLEDRFLKSNPNYEFTDNDVIAYVNTVKNEIRNRKIIYDSMNAKATEVSGIVHSAGNSVRNNKINLEEILGYILRNPVAAKLMGLLIDFELSDKDSKEIFKQKNRKGLKLSANIPETEGISFMASIENSRYQYSSDYEIVEMSGKYYHGIVIHTGGETNCGLHKVGYDSTYSLLFVNPEKTLQSIGFNAETIESDYIVDNKIVENRNLKIPRTDGMILFRSVIRKDRTQNDKDEENNDEVIKTPDGIVGQSVAVIEGDSYDKILSLCWRSVSHSFPNTIKPFKTSEEGWINPLTIMDSTKGGFYNQVIFHWTGNNLCIEEPNSIDDSTLPVNEDNIYKDTFEVIGEYLKDPEPEKRNVMLVEGRKYSFILKDVHANGYSIPNSSRSEFELGINDLMKKEEYKRHYTISSKFELNDPLKPPLFLQHKEEKKRGKSPYTLMIQNNYDFDYRYLIPPICDIQFLHFTGLLDRILKESNSKEDFLKKTWALVDKAKCSLPETLDNANKNLNYLPDSRKDKLVFVPTDWRARNMFFDDKKFVKYQFEGFFSHDETSIIDIKPMELVFTRSKENRFNIKKENGQIRIFLPDGMSLSLGIKRGVEKEEKPSGAAISFLNNNVFESCLPQSLKFPIQKFFLFNDKIPEANEIIELKAENDDYSCERHDSDENSKCDSTRYYKKLNLENYNSEYFNLPHMNSDIKVFDTTQILAPEVIQQFTDSDKYSELIKNEIPKSAFIKEIKKKEHGLYKNGLGFCFRFPDQVELLIGYKKGRTILSLDFSRNSSLQLIYERKTLTGALYYSFRLFGITLKLVNAIFERKLNSGLKTSAILNYGFHKKLTRLYAKLTIQEGTNSNDFFFIDESDKEHIQGLESEFSNIHYTSIQLPSPEVNSKNLVMSDDLEIKYCNSSDNALWVEYVYRNELFIYGTEDNPAYTEKLVHVEAFSTLSDIYKTSVKQDESKYAVNSCKTKYASKLILPNNRRPKTPKFTITPLLFHESHSSDKMNSKARYFQLMFEIEGREHYEEFFSLVVSAKQDNNNIIDDYCCSLGRDYTTLKWNRNEETDIEFNIGRSNQEYLDKYVKERKTCKPHNMQRNYNLQLLETYYDSEKKKWICLVDINNIVVGKELYNPFVKIVAANYCNAKSSKDEFAVSEFSYAKYINILSPRRITCSFEEKVVTLKVKAPHLGYPTDSGEKIVTKLDMFGESRSRFFACIRKIEDKVILGKTLLLSNKRDYVEIDVEKEGTRLSLPIGYDSKIHFVCIYEFETFDNTNLEIKESIDDYLDDPGWRLIYAEEF